MHMRYIVWGTAREVTVVFFHDSKNSFKFTVPERSLGGQYKLEESKKNRWF